MKKILALLVIIILLVFAIFGWWSSQLSPVSKDSKETKTVIIAKDSSSSQIAEKLKQEGLIKSPLIFRLVVKQKGLDTKIQAGTFKLSPSMSLDEIAQKLGGGAEEVWVTLLEGWRQEEMAEKLNKELGIENEEFLKLAEEGYMFPDTYLIPKEYSTLQVVQVIRDNFDAKFSSELKSKIRAQGLTEEEGIILASIVEREGRSDKARTEIASILLKRFKIEMGLNADATLQYALGFQKDENPPAGGWWKRHLTSEDKKIGSPYNTYLHRGLPPAPICNPSLSSIEAVANATSTPYLYYYHDSKGNSHYATTLDEHNKNVRDNP